jgi:Ca2+-binding EF-hand superfamily protein
VAPEKERVVEKKPDRSLPDGSPLRTDTRDYSQKRPRYSHVPNRAALNWERLKSEWERMDPSDPYYSTVFKISHMVKSLDTDQDERLTDEEWNVPAHYFRANDRNDDGFVTIDELERSLPDTHTKEEFFRIQDNDENGVIERVEFKGTPSLFDMLDTNKDKTISLGELMNSDFQP